ncbi:MAG: VCBS repeat-containing protein [Pseudomonadota bacterium]
MSRALALWLLLAQASAAQDIVEARYADPTTRYAHGVLGDAIEHGTLVMEVADGRLFRVTLPERRVFEDTAPRLFDVDGDNEREVIVVEADAQFGARLSIYDTTGLVASNEFIGQRNRWLAPAGIGAHDIDGDGRVELVFVDRPHLARTLRIYEYREGALALEASFQGVTNHRIGERDIAGGIRTCGGTPEVIVADSDWSQLVAVRWDGTHFDATLLGPHRGRESFSAAMVCKK